MTKTRVEVVTSVERRPAFLLALRADLFLAPGSQPNVPSHLLLESDVEEEAALVEMQHRF